MMLKNKKILVFGAAGLLGSNLAKHLLGQGASVVATDRNIIRLEARLKELGICRDTEAIRIQETDLLDKAAVTELFEGLQNLSGVVNCSYPRNKNYGKKFLDVQLEDFNENISLNLGSSFLLMKSCAEYFRRVNEPFSLVNISSVYGLIAPKFDIYDNTSMTMPVDYAAIKSGLIQLSKYVVQYVGDSKFRVNLVSPGGIFDDQPAEFLEAYKEHTLGRGMLDVGDVIGSILFLLSDYSQYINGQNIVVDDGFTL